MDTFKFKEQFDLKPPEGFKTTKETFITRGINFPALIKKVKENNHFNFSYKNFLSNNEEQQILSPDGITTGTGRFLDVPLYLKTKEGKQVEVKLKGKLNTREGQLDIRQNKVRFAFKMNAKRREIAYITKINYFFNNRTAIELSTFSYDQFILLSNELIFQQTPK